MRKVIVLSFISLDGVMQAPGGPEEDLSSDFQLGGWTVPYFDNFLEKTMASQLSRSFDLLLGRKTYDIFAAYWPHHKDEGPELNQATKYVVSHGDLELFWEDSVLLKGNIVEKISELKYSQGPDLHVHGSGELIQTLLKHHLVDELWLKIFPVVLGKGKRLFKEETSPVALKLIESHTSPSGVIAVKYTVSGEVETGEF